MSRQKERSGKGLLLSQVWMANTVLAAWGCSGGEQGALPRHLEQSPLHAYMWMLCCHAFCTNTAHDSGRCMSVIWALAKWMNPDDWWCYSFLWMTRAEVSGCQVFMLPCLFFIFTGQPLCSGHYQVFRSLCPKSDEGFSFHYLNWCHVGDFCLGNHRSAVGFL